ncbi:MAG: hypothetical protein N4A33_04845 [Bacteriovoracaceae bacterium]|jgi:hypothetical protein|nr:hypothetical protein [Bacteriovoracaceae bacterium]
MNKLSLLLALILITSLSFANDEQYYSISSYELVEVLEDADGHEVEKSVVISDNKQKIDEILGGKPKVPKKPGQAMTIGEVIKVGSDLVALGKDVYDLVKLGRPVLNVNTTPISIVPMNEQRTEVVAPFDMENWKLPKVKKFRVKANNYLGMEVINFTWKVIFNYGGSYMGKGAFITGAEIKPEEVDLGYGYSMDVTYKLQSMTNVGTKESPMAQAVLEIEMKVETMFKTSLRNFSYVINGAGGIVEL